MSAELATPSHTDDIIEHEETFEAFWHLIAIAAFHILSCVVALAIGGIEGHWLFAMFWIIAATIAAVAGLTMKNVGLKASAAVLALAVLSLI